MDNWLALLEALADSPADFDREGGEVCFVRQGAEYVLSLKDVAGAGVCVDDGEGVSVPLASYVQKEILRLPVLAAQVTRAIQKKREASTTEFVQGPGRVEESRGSERWVAAGDGLKRFLLTSNPGATRLVQLMAPAGQGKTMLLENTALELAREYQPDPSPMPLLLVVDLLGRYVGTIDDAIAGSLNNSYVFPGLSQRDVALCVRRRWIVLALDGFDELVARVGARDAFNRITELLDQLNSSGSVILSARESFFELYQISSAIRAYLQPRKGSYDVATIELLPWGAGQARDVFIGLGSREPGRDYEDLLSAFDGDAGLVLHPFFLTKLAKLWADGERFAGAGRFGSELQRVKYVIETFIRRESGDKWVGAKGEPLLDDVGHRQLLGAVAEEMWRSGAFALDAEELRIAGALGIASLDLPSSVEEGVVDRLPTHASLVSHQRGYAFIHDRFLHYFLGARMALLTQEGDDGAVLKLAEAKEFSPDVLMWFQHFLISKGNDPSAFIQFFVEAAHGLSDAITAGNLSAACASLLRDSEVPARLSGLTFSGDCLREGRFRSVRFSRCKFWGVDLSGSRFEGCSFDVCEFGDALVGEGSSFAGSAFEACSFLCLRLPDGHTLFAPNEIKTGLARFGAEFSGPESPHGSGQGARRVDRKATTVVEEMVRQSERACDMVVGELVGQFGAVGKKVVQTGRHEGVLRDVIKNTSGPKKDFVRIAVDRRKLLLGQQAPVGVKEIDGFWGALADKYPHRG